MRRTGRTGRTRRQWLAAVALAPATVGSVTRAARRRVMRILIAGPASAEIRRGLEFGLSEAAVTARERDRVTLHLSSGHDGGTVAGNSRRRRFMMQVAAAFSVLFALAILAQWMPAFLLDPCKY